MCKEDLYGIDENLINIPVADTWTWMDELMEI